jgi:hypothetical protein
MCIRAHYLSLSSARKSSRPILFWRCVLILSSHLRLGLPSAPFHSGFTTKTLHPPVFSPIRATCTANLTLHLNPNYMWYAQITKLIIMQSSPFPCHLIPPPQLEQRRRYRESLRAGRSGDRIPLGESFTATLYTVCGAHPATYKMGPCSFPLVKRPGCRVDHQSAANAEAKERVELHFHSPQVTGTALSFTFHNSQCPVLKQTAAM